MRTTWGLALAGLLGCTGKGDTGGDAESDADADADTDTDTDADADSDADVDTGEDTAPPPDTDACADFYVIAEGYTWTWRLNATGQAQVGGTGTITRAVASYDSASGYATLLTEEVYDAPSVDTTITTLAQHRCIDGALYLLSQQVDSVSVAESGATYTGEEDYVFLAPVLIMPADVGVGEEWSSGWEGSLESDGTSTPFSYAVENEVTGVEAVEVPAGSWDALRVASVSKEPGAGGNAWLVAGVGIVQTDLTELVSHGKK